jgi:hypothetical protein
MDGERASPTISHSHYALSSMKPTDISIDWSFLAGVLDRVASLDESDHRVGMTIAPMPCSVEFNRLHSFEYTHNAVSIMGEDSDAAASAGGEDGSESDSLCARFNSALTIPLPKPHDY